jgi:hypothetical protein
MSPMDLVVSPGTIRRRGVEIPWRDLEPRHQAVGIESNPRDLCPVGALLGSNAGCSHQRDAAERIGKDSKVDLLDRVVPHEYRLLRD